MKRIWMAGLIILSVAVGIFLGMHTKSSTAAPAAAFNQVMPFATVGGLLGFFDQANGKIYLYDREFKNCVFQLQLQNLGEPIDSLQSASSKEAPRYGITY